ncbi:hypothetical protein [Pseudomonas phage 98PfluR60PP]|uniref:Uncharacterized protein n=1 Tax=Pseudomonas phage 98PfluR60PP TaxID=2163965 RepID=A0A2S1PFZ5_9CAUD|nr:hypothetical protein PP760_gp61 [Pseudomonas phage 98PfluR60PP]AWH15493.1 hypothetical protein [Pseudomonas phage 98PfluR60PP]
MTHSSSSIVYDGANLVYVNATLEAWFGPSSNGAWSLVKVSEGLARVETRAGDIYFNTGDTLWIKGTSVLIEKA